MSTTEQANKRKVILLMAAGLSIPVLLITILIFAMQSDAKNKKRYEQQRAEYAEKFASKSAASEAQ